eukprot:1054639-Rhodomonas_salina.1
MKSIFEARRIVNVPGPALEPSPFIRKINRLPQNIPRTPFGRAPSPRGQGKHTTVNSKTEVGGLNIFGAVEALEFARQFDLTFLLFEPVG